MKTVIISILFAFSTFLTSAQTILNPSFDSVYIGGIDRIHSWIPSSASFPYQQQNTVLQMAPDSCYENLDPMLLFPVWLIYNSGHSGFGLSLVTTSYVKQNGDPYDTYLVNGGNSFKTGPDGYIAFERQGEPFPYRPNAMNGWYQYHDTIPQTVDYGRAMVLLKKYNPTSGKADTIAFGEKLLDTASVWTEFQVPLTYRSTAVPDSVVVLFIASTDPTEYGELWVDELSFDFTSSVEDNQNKDSAVSVIYPNPNSGIIQIKTENDYKVYKLFGIDSKLLKTGPFTTNINIEDIDQKALILQLIDKDGRVEGYRILKE